MKISSSDINILISAFNSMYAKKMSPRADGPNSQTVYEVTINEILTESGHQFHYGVVIMDTIASQITSLAIVFSTVYLDIYKKNIKVPRHWPLCGEFTGDRWITRTNGQ